MMMVQYSCSLTFIIMLPFLYRFVSLCTTSQPGVTAFRGWSIAGGGVGLPRRRIITASSLYQSRDNNSRRRSDRSLNTYNRHYNINNTQVITSSKSQTIKKIQALLTKRKKRIELGQTVVEGPRMVFDLLDNPRTMNLVQQVLLSARDEYDLRDDYRSRFILGDENEKIFVQLVHPDIFNKYCTNTITPQGIIAIADIPNNKDDDDDIVSSNNSIIANKDYSPPPIYLILDGVKDPGNLGTLLRTSLAVGAEVILLPDCCDVWNPKCVRSSMGASFQVPIIESPSWNDALLTLKSKRIHNVYAATMIEEEDGGENNDEGSSSNVPYCDVNWRQGCGLVIGSEGNGLRSEVKNDIGTSTKTINIRATHIPMSSQIESLNAAVCGSVILFEYARQCRQTCLPSQIK